MKSFVFILFYFSSLIISNITNNLIIGLDENVIDLVVKKIDQLINPLQSLNLAGINVLTKEYLINEKVHYVKLLQFYNNDLNILIVNLSILNEPKQATPTLIKSIKDNSGIKFIEHDKLLTSQALLSQPSPPSYGLSRISSRSLSRSRSSSPYIYDSHQGQNIDIYILDSGVNEQHRDFGGRAKLVANFVSNESEEDLFGHGTHVSGIIGGKDYGVAKKSNLYGIKILNKRGEGSVSQALYALAFIIKRVEKNPRRSIINLSLAGDFSEALNQAVDIAYKQLNIAVIVAAGNQNKNACLTSPGSAKGVVAVGNSDDNDRISRTSNYGPCITLFAPGSKIRSASNTDNFGSKILSGTSMAAPHIAGIAALFWSMKPQLNVEQLYTLIQNQATKNVLYNVPMDTPNLLAYNQF